jgi:flagellar biosynthetic protein FliO
VGDTFSIEALLRLVLSLGVLVGALYAVRWWQRRPGALSRRGAINIVARASVGRNSTVQVVDVGSKRFLVGISDHQVNLLSELPPDEELRPSSPAPSTSPVGASTEMDQPDGSGLIARTRPWIGPLDWLRTVTVRTPQQVRVIRDRGD